MIKKILLITTLAILLLNTTATVYAVGIDANLQPKNIPGVPGGTSEADCKMLMNQHNTSDKEFYKWKDGVCIGDEASPINEVLQVLGGALVMLSGGIAVIVIAVGGIMYITSRGNQQQMEYAKNTLVYGIIGIVVITLSYFIVMFVLKFITGV